MNMAIPTPSKSEKEWRAERDARTLAEAKVIMADPKRHKAAMEAAARMSAEQMAEAKAMRSVAGKKIRPEDWGKDLRKG